MQLDGGTNDSPILGTTKDEETMAVLGTRPSLFSRVDKSITEIADKTGDVLISTQEIMVKAQAILSEKNIENLEKILKNSADLSESIVKTAKSLEMQRARIDSIMKHAIELEKAAIYTAERMRDMSDTISGIVKSTGVETMDKMRTAADSVKFLMKKIEDKFDSGMFDIDSIAKEALTPAENTLNELEALMIQTQELLEKFEESPSDLIFKSTPTKAGPGEKQ